MTRVFAIAILVFAAGGCPGARAQEVPLGDQCVAIDKKGNLVSSLVDDKGNQVFLHVEKDGTLQMGGKPRDPQAAAECAYVLCGERQKMNRVSACKTGRKDPPPTPSGILPSMIKMVTPEQRDLQQNGPTAVSGIRG